MIQIFKKVRTALNNRTSYKVGLLQAKVYRILKHATRDALEKIDPQISTIHWAFLGLLFENKIKGVRFQEAAEMLGVEAPFITVLAREMTRAGFVASKKDPLDTRAKRLYLSEKGEAFVEKTEPALRAAVKPLLQGVPLEELLSYISVLEKILENSNTDSQALFNKKNIT